MQDSVPYDLLCICTFFLSDPSSPVALNIICMQMFPKCLQPWPLEF